MTFVAHVGITGGFLGSDMEWKQKQNVEHVSSLRHQQFPSCTPSDCELDFEV